MINATRGESAHWSGKQWARTRMTTSLLGVTLLFAGCGTDSATTATMPVDLTRLTDALGAVTLSVSPDGRYVLYDVVVDGATDIRRFDMSTSVSTTLLGGQRDDRRPTWSPSGDLIAFVSDRGGVQGLWIAASSGGGARHLFDAGERSMSAPVWSPDGSALAFSILDPERAGNISYGRGTIMVVEVASGTATEITSRGDEWWPTWSRDGTELFYYVGKTDVLKAVAVSTGEVRALWDGRFVGWRPAASPTSDSLAFVSDMDGLGLFTANLASGAPPKRQLGSGEPNAPAWLPDGSGLVFMTVRRRL